MFSDHPQIDINGAIFDIKHKIGGSSIEHGRHTAISKERWWNILWQDVDNSAKADVLIRAHVHYYRGAFGPDWVGWTMPALQSLGTKFGSRQCVGTVDYGVVEVNVTEKGEVTWKPHLCKFPAAQRELYHI